MRYVVLALLLVAGVAHSQPAAPPHPTMQPPDDPVGERLFPPELIMSHQRELALDGKTRAAMVEDVQRFQTLVVKLQWDLKQEGEALAKLLEAAQPDEEKVLAQADKVMALEREVKRAHLGLLVRLKSRLTPAQQAMLQKVRRAAR
jgi:Spy/CpxP family protein refolding chaperone